MTAQHILSQQQAQHLKILGYVVLRQAITADALIMDEANTVSCNPLFQGIATDILGSTATLKHFDKQQFSEDIGWHNDQGNRPGIRLHLFSDRLTVDDGRFMVIPGSHYPTEESSYSRMLTEALHQKTLPLGLRPESIPGYIINTRPGDIIITDHGCEYAIFKIKNSKHALIIDFNLPECSSTTERAPE